MEGYLQEAALAGRKQQINNLLALVHCPAKFSVCSTHVCMRLPPVRCPYALNAVVTCMHALLQLFTAPWQINGGSSAERERGLERLLTALEDALAVKEQQLAGAQARVGACLGGWAGDLVSTPGPIPKSPC